MSGLRVTIEHDHGGANVEENPLAEDFPSRADALHAAKKQGATHSQEFHGGETIVYDHPKGLVARVYPKGGKWHVTTWTPGELHGPAPARPIDLELRGAEENAAPCDACASPSRPVINTAREAAQAALPHVAGLKQEVYALLLLDVHGQLLEQGYVEIAKGQHAAVNVDVRDIIRPAMRAVSDSHANRFVSLHNHPSGVVRPSRADRDLWKRIGRAFKEAGVDCAPVDHLVIGSDGKCYFSLAEGKSARLDG